MVQIYKTIMTTYPKYIYSKLCSEFPYNTRLAQSDSVRMGPDFMAKLELTEKSFLNRATVSFNKLPSEIRKIEKLEAFKAKLKEWVLENCMLLEIHESPGTRETFYHPHTSLVEVYLLIKILLFIVPSSIVKEVLKLMHTCT